MSSPSRRDQTDLASIEAVIPLHDTNRPIRRTLESLLNQRKALAESGAILKVSVVCHNITADSVRTALGEELMSAGVSLIELNDDIYSPAGPKNHALNLSRADYITFVDSDDYLEQGALQSWFTTARLTGASAVLAPIRMTNGAILTSPRIRPSKPRILHPVRDGLATRSLPHGLLRRSKLEEIDFQYTAGLRSGEDLEPTLRLFFTGGPIAYPYGGPAYCQTDDAGEGRVTASVGPLDEELAWFAPLAGQEWIRRASKAQRRTIGTKLMRVHGIGALRRRGEIISRNLAEVSDATPASDLLWNAEELAAWRSFYAGVEKLAGDRLAALSIRDARLARAALEIDDPADLALAAQNYSASKRWDVMMAQHLHMSLGKNSVLRHYVNERRRRDAGVFATPSPSETLP